MDTNVKNICKYTNLCTYTHIQDNEIMILVIDLLGDGDVGCGIKKKIVAHLYRVQWVLVVVGVYGPAWKSQRV